MRKRKLVLALAIGYLALVVGLPLGAIAVRLAEAGISPVLRSLGSPDVLNALTLTVEVTVLAVLVNGLFGVCGALVLVRDRFPGKRWLDTLVDLPLAVSPVMTGLAFLLLFGRHGLFEPVLEAVGWKVTFAFPGLVLATLFVTLPLTVREVGHVLRESGQEEEEAAATLGASAWQTFVHVTLPKIRGGLSVGITLSVARSLGEFGAVLVLGGAISGKTQTATTLIYSALEERDTTAAFGIAVVLLLTSIALLFLLRRVRAPKEA
jgi:sulfate transport system permease protein